MLTTPLPPLFFSSPPPPPAMDLNLPSLPLVGPSPAPTPSLHPLPTSPFHLRPLVLLFSFSHSSHLLLTLFFFTPNLYLDPVTLFAPSFCSPLQPNPLTYSPPVPFPSSPHSPLQPLCLLSFHSSLLRPLPLPHPPFLPLFAQAS